MTFFLNAKNGKFPLRAGMNIVGRHKDADIRLDAPHISRKHISIDVLTDGTFTLMDLGSSNGLFIDGKKVPNGIVQAGKKFMLGESIFSIEEE